MCNYVCFLVYKGKCILIISKNEVNKENIYFLKTRFVDIHMYLCVQICMYVSRCR